MRILLTHHSPLRQSAPGWLVWQWGLALQAAGNQVRLLVVDSQQHAGEPIAVERVVCGSDPQAAMRMAPPRFRSETDATGRPLFASLTDSELMHYRDLLRQRLDQEIAQFDPHILHAQHIWVLGQLALESGVPYVLNAWNDELAEYQDDERYRVLAEQAAENASRILTPDEPTRERVELLFEPIADRTIVMPSEWKLTDSNVSPDALTATGDGLAALYQAVLEERFG